MPKSTVRRLKFPVINSARAARYLIIGGQSLEIDVRSNGYDTRKTVFMKGQDIPVEIEDYNLSSAEKNGGYEVGQQS